MKKKLSITLWINRLLITLFVGALLFAFFGSDSDYMVYSYIIAFPLGIFQLFSFLFSVIRYKKLGSEVKKYVKIYSIIFASYLVFGFVYLVYLNAIESMILAYCIDLIPILLSLFWTYILEISKR
ncbi:hypothetical protein [uncultured Polaribacter sp.]|uniref:hypothetical protein n=1 Tax=uncultured Polaribacter sp. TaxID=174711 RepID=UPI00261F0660|nr:hypothetical protein [uncultured Polaribacter sp.]